MLLSDKIKSMGYNLSDLFYDYGDELAHYYLEHKLLLNLLGSEVDRVFLKVKNTDICSKICLLNTSLLMSIDIDNINFLYSYYGIRKIVINLYSLESEMVKKENSFNISDEFLGDDIIKYKIVSLYTSTKIFEYIDEDFTYFMDIDINLVEVDKDFCSKLIFMTDNRIYYNFDCSKLNNYGILTECRYKKLVRNNFKDICNCVYRQKIKSIYELNINNILDYLLDKENIFIMNADIYIVLSIPVLFGNAIECEQKISTLMNNNFKFISVENNQNFDNSESRFHFKINLGEKKCI